MRRMRKNEYQFNVKQTEKEWEKLQAVNQKYFDGQLNISELGRFLFQVALNALEEAEVKTSKVTRIKVDGKEINIE